MNDFYQTIYKGHLTEGTESSSLSIKSGHNTDVIREGPHHGNGRRRGHRLLVQSPFTCFPINQATEIVGYTRPGEYY